MNFLAHAFLARDDADLMLGSLMGDFVKGPLDDRYGPAIKHGLILHRSVDTYTDAHALVARSRARIGPARRRYAGILVDLFYDHYLARNWNEYTNVPLDRFTESVYANLLARSGLLPERLQRIAPHMARTDWLGSYRDTAAVGEALDRIGTRLKRGNGLLGSLEDLVENYAGLEEDFRAFFPDAMQFAQRYWAQAQTEASRES
jgi:acyl carrier protein phosphodiesterase